MERYDSRRTARLTSRSQSVDLQKKLAKRDLLRSEVDRLRNPNYAPIKGALPSPSRRTQELPKHMISPEFPELGHFTVPQASKNPGSMLRTNYMDESINNQLKQRTLTELRESKRMINAPHQSYDIDGDGFISQSDYQLAKRFDADGNGVIDKDEMDAGKRLIAKELWERYRAQHFLQKAPISDHERQGYVDQLVALKDEHGAFMRDYERIKNKHWIEEQRGSAQVLECVSKPNLNMYEPKIFQHPVPVANKPRTRSELFEERRRAYTQDVNERIGSDIIAYDDSAIFRNYNQRDGFVKSDKHSWKRSG